MMNNDMDYNRGPPNRRRNYGPVPVREGETYDVSIEGIGEKGDGIAKINGFVIVVPNTQQGQRVKVRINAVRGKVSFGEVVGEAAPATEQANEGESHSEESSSPLSEEESQEESEE